MAMVWLLLSRRTASRKFDSAMVWLMLSRQAARIKFDSAMIGFVTAIMVNMYQVGAVLLTVSVILYLPSQQKILKLKKKLT
jgi:hypothetical protein